MLARTLNSRSLVTAEGSEVLALIAGYARTWHLLLKYDENNLHLPDGCQPAQYKTREEKAAHLLYFVIKDHPFTDGNKRIGSFMFLLYLQQEAMAMTIDETALTALALLVAESQPASKDLMIRLIVNLLVISTPNS